MARIPVGAPYRAIWRTYGTDGTTLTNATANSLTVKRAVADGTSTATAGSPYITPVNDSTGLYHQDIAASDIATAGHYQWVNTSTGTAPGAQFGEFDVFDPFEVSVLPLPDAKDALNIPQTVTAYDTEIQAYVASIESCLERMTGGPMVNTTITSERCEMTKGQSVILVRQRPLVSVTSITAESSGTAVDISGGLDLDKNAGVIRRQFTGWPFILPTFAWQPIVLVTYVAGWGVSVPAAFNTASRIILQNLWNTQRGPSARPSMGGADALVMPPGFTFGIPPAAAAYLNGSLGGLPFMTEAYF